MNKKIIGSVIIGVVALIVLVVINPFTVIPSGNRGVVLNWGAFQGETLDPGLHALIPIQQKIIKVNVQTQKIEIAKSQTYSHDLQVVDVHSVVNYNVDPKEVGNLYADIGLDFETKILQPALESAVKQIYAKYSAEELLSKRGQVQSEIEQTFRDSIQGKHIVVTKYELVNENFSDAYEKAIEEKQVAEQAALKADNDLKRIKIEADQRIAQAQAEAEAIKIQAQAITQQGGKDYVDLKAVEKWDGHLPTQMIPGSSLPFLNINR